MVELVLAFVIAILLIGSLILDNYLKVPLMVTTLLIFAFISTKIYNLVEKNGSLIMEDFLSLGILIVFLMVNFFIGKSLSAISIVGVSIILFYSIGLMPRISSLVESRKISSFILSYLIFVLIIIFLFAGFYASNSEDFIENTKPTEINFRDSLYFSTATFTTVGYGDISPLGINRMIASIEALTGAVLNIAFIGYILASKRFY